MIIRCWSFASIARRVHREDPSHDRVHRPGGGHHITSGSGQMFELALHVEERHQSSRSSRSSVVCESSQIVSNPVCHTESVTRASIVRPMRPTSTRPSLQMIATRWKRRWCTGTAWQIFRGIRCVCLYPRSRTTKSRAACTLRLMCYDLRVARRATPTTGRRSSVGRAADS